MATFARRDIWNLDDEGGTRNAVTRAYADAVGVMKQRSAADREDPTGWTYQASVHAVQAGASPDPFQDQCQHGSCFFLPWHRHRAAERAQRVRETWALLYWNYSRGRQAERRRTLPRAFRTATKNDGAPNPLFTSRRNTGLGLNMNAGDPLRDQLSRSARSTSVSSPPPRSPAGPTASAARLPAGTMIRARGQSGDHPARRRPHQRRRTRSADGDLSERAPRSGVLAAPRQHRLWVVWLNQSNFPRRNPTDAGWRSFPSRSAMRRRRVTPPWSPHSPNPAIPRSWWGPRPSPWSSRAGGRRSPSTSATPPEPRRAAGWRSRPAGLPADRRRPRHREPRCDVCGVREPAGRVGPGRRPGRVRGQRVAVRHRGHERPQARRPRRCGAECRAVALFAAAHLAGWTAVGVVAVPAGELVRTAIGPRTGAVTAAGSRAVAALVLSVAPHLRSEEVRGVLQRSATRIGDVPTSTTMQVTAGTTDTPASPPPPPLSASRAGSGDNVTSS